MIKPGMYLSDRYEIIDKVGSGGMADVYKARDHKLNRFVAIKILKIEYNDDKNFVKKFRGEAQSAAGLSHPNIVNIYDVGEDDGMHYIIMELIEGITLKRFIERKGKLEIREAIGIGIQIAQGMEVAHANHIIHRDIKPQNIIISREGKVKVTDFGIAKATSSNTITSNAMGSVHYFSPEQARGGYCDEKSDIYSLGVTMYEMISGHVPFEGENAVSVALLHIQNEAKPLKEIDPSVPISVDRIVQKCMQKKPERRYLSVSELVADLKRSIIEPDVDFVVIPDILKEKQPTVVLSKEEIETIRKASAIKEVDVEPVKEELQEDIYQEDLPQDYEYDDDTADDEAEDEYDVDDEDDEEEATKGEKIATIVAISSAVIVGLLVIFVVLKMTGVIGGTSKKPEVDSSTTAPVATQETSTPEPTQEPEDVDAPSLVGKTLDEAREIAERNGFTLRYEEVESAKAKGIVVSQEVEGNIIKVLISDGSGNVEMIDVTNKSVAEAKSTLTEEGFTGEFKTEYVNSDEIEIGFVVKTDPEAGAQVKIIDLEKITLFVSEGASTTTNEVPTLLGKTEEEAKEAIEAAKMVVGQISSDYSDDYDEGLVMAQSKKAGTKVTEGAKIDITISLGKKEEEKPELKIVPKLMGMTEEEATKALENAGLKVKKVYMDYSDDVEEGLVIRQTVSPGEQVEEGTEVTFTISLGKKEEPTVEPTQEPTPEPVVKHSYQASVQVFNYGENPFMDPALAEGEDADKTSGTIKIQVVNSNDNKVVYSGSLDSSYDTFSAGGLNFSFTFDSDVETTSDQLVFTYTFDNRNYDYSGSSKVDLSSTN